MTFLYIYRLENACKISNITVKQSVELYCKMSLYGLVWCELANSPYFTSLLVQLERETETETDRETDRQTNRQTDRNRERETERET